MEQVSEAVNKYLPPINTAIIVGYAIYATNKINKLEEHISSLEIRLKALEGSDRSTTQQLSKIRKTVSDCQRDTDRLINRKTHPTPAIHHNREESKRTPKLGHRNEDNTRRDLDNSPRNVPQRTLSVKDTNRNDRADNRRRGTNNDSYAETNLHQAYAQDNHLSDYENENLHDASSDDAGELQSDVLQDLYERNKHSTLRR